MSIYKDNCEMTAEEQERHDLLGMKSEIEQRLFELQVDLFLKARKNLTEKEK